MKRQLLRASALLILSATMAVASVSAQSPPKVRINIPFDFIVGQKMFSAGQYMVRRINRNQDTALLIQSADGRESQTFITQAGQTGTAQSGAEMLFHQYGEQYFLSQVWMPWNSVGRELSPSGRERMLSQEMTSNAQAVKSTAKSAIRRNVIVDGGGL